MKGFDLSARTGGHSPSFQIANPELKTTIIRRKSLLDAEGSDKKFTGPIYLAVLNYDSGKHCDREIRSIALADPHFYHCCVNSPTLYKKASDAQIDKTLLFVFDTNAWYSTKLERLTRVVLFNGKTYYPVRDGFPELRK